VRWKLDLHDVHVGECARVLGGAPQNSWFIKVLGQATNSSSMPPPRLPLLLSPEPALIGLVEA